MTATKANAGSERRLAMRTPCYSRAILAVSPSALSGPGAEDLLLEVVTKDISDSGVCVVGPPGVRTGQTILFRMGMSEGLAISGHGRVTRASHDKRCASARKRDFGIAFEPDDARMFQRLGVFGGLGAPWHGRDRASAVLVSNHPLELVWWFARLPKHVHEVLVGTGDNGAIERMQKMDSSKIVRRLDIG